MKIEDLGHLVDDSDNEVNFVIETTAYLSRLIALADSNLQQADIAKVRKIKKTDEGMYARLKREGLSGLLTRKAELSNNLTNLIEITGEATALSAQSLVTNVEGIVEGYRMAFNMYKELYGVITTAKEDSTLITNKEDLIVLEKLGYFIQNLKCIYGTSLDILQNSVILNEEFSKIESMGLDLKIAEAAGPYRIRKKIAITLNKLKDKDSTLYKQIVKVAEMTYQQQEIPFEEIEKTRSDLKEEANPTTPSMYA